MIALGESYIRAIHRVGATPIIIPPTLQSPDIPSLLSNLDGLLLSGGEDIAPRHYGQKSEAWMGRVDEVRDMSELGLIKAWLAMGKPLLAICRGHQVLNVALGGTLFQDISKSLPDALDHAYVPARPMEITVHPVKIELQSQLATIMGGITIDVNSAHHQAIHAPGAGVRVVAYAPDGVIEAIELPQYHFCIGVQWHPEAMVKVSETMLPLFSAFVQAC